MNYYKYISIFVWFYSEIHRYYCNPDVKYIIDNVIAIVNIFLKIHDIFFDDLYDKYIALIVIIICNV